MFDLILFILATIGMTLIIVDGKIAQPFRKWARSKKSTFLIDIISCHQCCGFWSGIFCGIMTLLPYYLILNKLFLFGCAASFVSMLGAIIVDYYNALLYIEKENDEEIGNS